MLCGPVGPKLKVLLPEQVYIPERCAMSDDENHLILEYQRHEKWGRIDAPVANRFIMSHDVSNSALSTLEAFISKYALDVKRFVHSKTCFDVCLCFDT